MLRTLLSATIVLAATLVCVPAWADDSGAVTARFVVKRADAGDEAGAREVYRRLKVEARYVCDTAASYDRDYNTSSERACEARTVSDAVRQIDKVELSRIDDQANGRAVHDLSMNTTGR